MPELVPITNNFFVNLITRLGLKPPPGLGWMMQTQVVPVSIVDTDITLSAVSTSAILDTPFTAGPLAVGTAANTVHADTGAQNAGNYALTIIYGGDFTAGNTMCFLLQRRDAANAANVWEQSVNVALSGSSYIQQQITVKLLQGERIRVLNRVISVFTTEQVSIWLQSA